MDKLIVSPIQKYEINGEVCKLMAVTIAGAVGVWTSIVAADPLRIHRLMGWCVAGQGGITNFYVAGGVGATNIMGATPVLAQAGGIPGFLPIVDCGYGETLINQSLQVFSNAFLAVGTVWYISYLP